MDGRRPIRNLAQLRAFEYLDPTGTDRARRHGVASRATVPLPRVRAAVQPTETGLAAGLSLPDPVSCLSMPDDSQPFVAIDFETANRCPTSACAVALVRVEKGRVVSRVSRRIRPPSSEFEFTYIHGLSWDGVREAPTFGETWSDIEAHLDGAAFFCAHNATFDRRVLHACCRLFHLVAPKLPFRCTLQIARRTWRLPQSSLPAVCQVLGIPLRHHDPLSDAEACANVFLAAETYHRHWK